MRSGKTVAVRDATVFPVGANGKADKEAAAPFTVSADGARILYFRKSDRKLVWRAATGGRAHSLPGATARVPKGIGMGDVDATLSPDGGVVVLDYLDDNERLPTLVVDLADGHVARVPGSDAVHGFSPDGRRLLVSRQTSDNTTEFAVYDADGAQAESREVPQVVSNNAPVALADDGVTVAVVIVPSEGRPRLRQYDLSTDAVSPAVDLPITAQDAPYQIFWNDAGKLTLWHMRTKSDGTVSRVTASVVDPATGGLRKIDSFKGPSRVWNWWLPGE
ncbi:hypothetical protein [Sphaerisporangium siamense]|uniref:Dipeptidyl aminopeptidase/acylaminoacyl peptidase n=1 Tax=Sphaerisporangium siamense TaxID=795645 RepID=A0A7W7G780_9ACTN|nr:hypothetical protein [Sphaerisporangium siamense]MBB4698857.1 dipeptidyl aminopeptidase/acylaminoacyl peptidase [Sphaerisporangium siamense]